MPLLFLKKIRHYRFAMLVLVFFVLLIGINFVKPKTQARPPTINGTILSSPRSITPFTLTGSNGQPFTEHDLTGHWTLLYTGYTACTDICPITLTKMKQVWQSLHAQGRGQKMQFLFVSIDPKHDTPARLHDYVTTYDKDFLAATGDDSALRLFTQQFGVPYVQQHNEETDDIITHGSMLILINPKAQYQAVFTAPHDAQEISEQLLALENFFD